MLQAKRRMPILGTRLSLASFLLCVSFLTASDIKLNQQDYFEAQGLSVLLYHNAFHGIFVDEKMSGLEIILHGERIATNGDVRLSAAPTQWDATPQFKERKRGPGENELIATCAYPDHGLSYKLDVTVEGDGLRVAVNLDQPLPAKLAGKAGFNLEFLPTSYFGKSYMLDDGFGVFPRHENGAMRNDPDGTVQPLAFATGHRIVLSPEDPSTRVTITSDGEPLMLFDGRTRAQNGWFLVRTLIPSGKTDNAVVWHIRPNLIPGWTRPPVVAYNQVGYTPERSKVAVIELDPLYAAPKTARLLKLGDDGQYKEVFSDAIKPWGKWLRYQYAQFDFSSIHEPGVYAIEYAGHVNGPFRIAKDLYHTGVWQSSLDTWFPVQMDHVKVREGYRIWHGASHLDDARQAPLNHKHFDGYVQGPTTDSPYKPGEHIPGLNVGGWYDAGDYDIRTESQSDTVTDLALTRENFGIDWDETTVDETARYVQIRKPDGIPDVIQQVKHGALGLLAQYKAFGHAIPGIIEPTLDEYTHLGDAASKTDGRIYSDKLGPLETNGEYSGVPDDRWAFTNRNTALDYHSLSALAAASRVLKGFDDKLAADCLQAAEHAWDEDHRLPPTTVSTFNTAGGFLEGNEMRAAVELLLATNGGEVYRKRLKELLPLIQQRFAFLGWIAVRAIPLMDVDYKDAMATSLRAYKVRLDDQLSKNPYGVPIVMGTWGGSSQVVGFGAHMYFFHKAFPEIVGTEYTLRALDYVLGTHPVSNVSYVSSVGTESKLIAYGNNRADYSFIPGGMIPGVVIIKPDFPELKSAWPYLWYENEYVIDAVAAFILEANAADALAK